MSWWSPGKNTTVREVSLFITVDTSAVFRTNQRNLSVLKERNFFILLIFFIKNQPGIYSEDAEVQTGPFHIQHDH